MKTAMWQRREGDALRCLLCPHSCLLQRGQVGKCRVREHVEGVGLVSLNYGKISALATDPIEKKPLYHWNPGTEILSVGTVGCSMDCPFCQNWAIAGWEKDIPLRSIEPKDLAVLAKDARTEGVAFTYNEPLVWYEFVLESSEILKKEGLHPVLVTNGMILPDPLEELLPFISAANVDLKAFTPGAYRLLGGNLGAVKNTIAAMTGRGIPLEVTFLLVPGINDDREAFEEMLKWLASLDPTPVLHISRYHPCRNWDAPSTPLSLMEEFCALAKKALPFVYPGNTGDEAITRCQSCGEALVTRKGYSIVVKNLDIEGRCEVCGGQSPIIFTKNTKGTH